MMSISIMQIATGQNIKRLMDENGFTVRHVQEAMGFEHPQAIYKWLSGKSLPSIDNLVILGRLFKVTIDDILVLDGDFVALRAA